MYTIPKVTMAFILCTILNFTLFVASGDAQTYDYLPGDVNMRAGEWPPVANAGDFICLMRGGDCLCEIEGFYPPADINGDCQIIGSDLTRYITYLRGLASLYYCYDFIPSWPTPEDLPDSMPDRWPPCEDYPLDPPTDEIFVWFGNVDSSPIRALIDDRLDIDVYIQTTGNCYVSNVELHIGVDSQYIESFLTTGHLLYPPLDEWGLNLFSNTYGSPPNPAGWFSQTFLSMANIHPPDPSFWLHYTVPTRIMTIALHVSPDSANGGDTCNALGPG